MSFQTSVLENGQWVTRTIGVNTILQPGRQQEPQQTRVPQRPLDCGILTRTLIESPVVNNILPVRLRSSRANDVAFIGDHFVQICELRPHREELEESLHDVIRKNDFGSRIRNAKVFGPVPDVDYSMGGTQEAEDELDSRTLPPQMLVLALENGDVVFLFVEENAYGALEFRWVREESRDRTAAGHPGFRMAIDPESRHLALACPEGLLVVYELESMQKLTEQYAQRQPLQPIAGRHKKSLDVDIIQQMEFLYPQPNAPTHSILLLIIVERNQAKMISYDWTAGDNITEVLDDPNKRPHRLPARHQTPILLIPVTVISAFLIISENSVGSCKGVLEGSPAFESVHIEYSDKTAMHHGLEPPLWTAWTRPYRMHSYTENNDAIYLGREDGVVVLLESDKFNVLSSSLEVGKFDCNISTAFCGVPGRFSDILIIGGESGPGKLLAFPPRYATRDVARLPNWSPSVDLAIVRDPQSVDSKHFARSDRLFAATGRGVHGAITEYRHGLKAIIGAEIDHDLSHRAWFFQFGNIYHILISVANKSDALGLDAKWDNVGYLSEDEAPYDLLSQTIEARQMTSGLIVQVTATSVTLVTPFQHARHPIAEILHADDLTVVAASIGDDVAVLATHARGQYHFHLLSLSELRVSVIASTPVDGSISAVSVDTFKGTNCVLVATWLDGLPSISLHQVKGDWQELVGGPVNINIATATMSHEPSQPVMDPSSSMSSSPIEQITSIVVSGNDIDQPMIVMGTRSGDIVTICPTDDGHVVFAEKFGVSASHVRHSGLPSSALVCTDDKLYLISQPSRKLNRFSERDQVFALDMSNQSSPTIPIASVSAIAHSSGVSDGTVDLVMLGGDTGESKILLTQLLPGRRPLPRSIPVHGTATVVIYSKGLGCLVAAVERDGCTSLVFIDPETGEDLSQPSNKDREWEQNISGLGKKDDKIFSIFEWLFENRGQIWRFFVVGTRGGRLVIVSAEVNNQVPTMDESKPSRKIRYWTRHRVKMDEPITAIVAGNDGLFFCGNDLLHWQRLDLNQKRLIEVETYEIDSPAVALELHGKSLFALSLRHSLEVIEWKLDMDESKGNMELLHCDPITREAVHMITLGDDDTPEQKRQLVMLSDKHGGITGMTVPWGKVNAEFSIIFDGELPSSIRKFRLGHFRPYWQRLDRKTQYGAILNAPTGEDMLGLCIDGSLVHLTLMDLNTTKLLKLIQALAEESELVCPFNQHVDDDIQDEGPAGATYKKHVDGDILQNCLDKRALEKLFDDAERLETFQEFLARVDGGIWTQGFSPEDKSGWFEVGYDILEYFLAPVL
ncbi:putative fun12-general translation factor eif2 like-protein [Zalerion maritima]|uniref:Fun12-general translation factor eif2 like-protein n=1 Tax=Zalerion maritima TaxID=339359 RepID=A0AAD5WUN6_9PEZI|nr:putative fun12-general translation factor eif2 like-protein [Zalerion maritima]